jgi:hypothetical protein
MVLHVPLSRDEARRSPGQGTHSHRSVPGTGRGVLYRVPLRQSGESPEQVVLTRDPPRFALTELARTVGTMSTILSL